MGYLGRLMAAAVLAAAPFSQGGCSIGYLSYTRAEYDLQTRECVMFRAEGRDGVYQFMRNGESVIIERCSASVDDSGRVDFEPVKRKPLEGVLKKAFEEMRENEGRKKVDVESLLR